MSNVVTCSIDGGVADVRLNRPDKLNSLTPELFAALVDTGDALAADNGIRAVVLSGEGRGFCAGLDFSVFQQMSGGGDPDAPGPGTNGRAILRPPAPGQPVEPSLGQRAALVWRDMPVPVIAAIRGPALGGGFQIALGADIRIVAPDAKLSVLEIRWGLIPDMTGTQLLPRLVGDEVARELLYTGRMLSGVEAAELGICSRVSDTPLEDALALAAEIASKSPHAIRGGKRLLNMAGVAPMMEAFGEEQRTMASLIGSPNNIEAVTAYFEKRDPKFTDPEG